LKYKVLEVLQIELIPNDSKGITATQSAAWCPLIWKILQILGVRNIPPEYLTISNPLNLRRIEEFIQKIDNTAFIMSQISGYPQFLELVLLSTEIHNFRNDFYNREIINVYNSYIDQIPNNVINRDAYKAVYSDLYAGGKNSFVHNIYLFIFAILIAYLILLILYTLHNNINKISYKKKYNYYESNSL